MRPSTINIDACYHCVLLRWREDATGRFADALFGISRSVHEWFRTSPHAPGDNSVDEPDNVRMPTKVMQQL